MNFEQWKTSASEEIGEHNLEIRKLSLPDIDHAIKDLADAIPDHYICPDSLAETLKKLGKPAAAQKLKSKLTDSTTLRSGEAGEILATEYIDSQTDFNVEIKKLRWHDHRDMAMRGEDAIGIAEVGDTKLRFLKTEAKSRKALSTSVLEDIRKALDNDDSRPNEHALGFIVERLNERGNTKMANKIEAMMYKYGIFDSDIEHLSFTFSGNNSKNFQKTMLETYDGLIKQHAVGLFYRNHQEFIKDAFDQAKESLDD